MKSYPKIRPVRDKRYLKWVISHKPCYICGSLWNGEQQIVYAHQTIPEVKYISVKGTGQKEHDNHVLPEHSIEHIDWEHGKGNHIDNRLNKVLDLNMEYLFNYNVALYKKVIELMPKLKEHQVLEYITINW